MSNIDRDVDFSDLTTALRFVLDQDRKKIHTAMPGIVESYDPASRRAQVRPALRMALTDGGAQARAALVNVPVSFPAGGGYTMTFPLAAGDNVLLVFSMRGLREWRRTFAAATPGDGNILDGADAVAVAGFGPLAITPATVTGAALQTTDGRQSVRVENDRVEVRADGAVTIAATGAVTIEAGGTLTLRAPAVEIEQA